MNVHDFLGRSLPLSLQKLKLIKIIKLWDSLHRVILSCYLLTFSVTQNADAVLTSRDRGMTNDFCFHAPCINFLT